MLVSASKNLEDSIIEILTIKKELSEKDIQDSLLKKGSTPTVQGVYRVLRKLQKEGIVVKHKKYFSIRLAWLLELSRLVEKMESTYLKESYLSQFLPAPGKQLTWNFTDLFKMNSFWSQLLLALAKKSTSKIAFNYSPHLWYVPLQEEQEEQFINTYIPELKKSYMVIGSRSEFDKYNVNLMNSIDKKEERYMASSPSEYISKNPSEYLDIIDDYILTVKIDKETTRTIEEIFQESSPLFKKKILPIHRIYTKKTKGKIILKNNHQKAKKYKNKFAKIFGPIPF